MRHRYNSRRRKGEKSRIDNRSKQQDRRTHADEREVNGRRLLRRSRVGCGLGAGGVRLDGAGGAEPPPAPLLMRHVVDRAVLLPLVAAAAGRNWMGRGRAEEADESKSRRHRRRRRSSLAAAGCPVNCYGR